MVVYFNLTLNLTLKCITAIKIQISYAYLAKGSHLFTFGETSNIPFSMTCYKLYNLHSVVLCQHVTFKLHVYIMYVHMYACMYTHVCINRWTNKVHFTSPEYYSVVFFHVKCPCQVVLWTLVGSSGQLKPQSSQSNQINLLDLKNGHEFLGLPWVAPYVHALYLLYLSALDNISKSSTFI